MKDIILTMRPAHWSKNIFVFAALIFSQKLAQPMEEVKIAVLSSIAGFICFCLASSATYIFNDIIDRQADKNHSTKSKRPIASGKVSVPKAVILSIICAAVAIVGSYALVPQFCLIISAYLLLNIFYTLRLKNTLILDVIIISLGFVFRAIAGAVVIGADISPWLIICTFALCLFLGFGKRRSELLFLKEAAPEYRKTLGLYTPELLGHMLNVTSSIAIISFLLYAMDSRTISHFGSHHLVYTSPMVLYCVFRFSAMIQNGKYPGPVELIIHDKPFQLGFALWVIACFIIIYGNKFNIDIGITY